MRASLVLLPLLALSSLVEGSGRPWDHGSVEIPREHLEIICAQRLTAGRWTTCSRYLPVTDLQDPTASFASADLAEALRYLEAIPESERTPFSESAHALLQVRLGDLDEALALLESATTHFAHDATVWANLAALRLLRFHALESAAELIKGLDAAVRAVDFSPILPVALFNLAVALDTLSLRDEAELAWGRYLETDPGSRWAAEARERATQGTRVNEFPNTRDLRDRILAVMGDADLVGDSGSDRGLLGLGSLTSALAAHSTDRLAQDAIATLQQSDHRGSAQFQRGHAALRRGYRLYQAGRLAEARQNLIRARQNLSEVGSPTQHLASLYLACVAQQEEDLEQSLRILLEVKGSVNGAPYWELRGLVSWMEGLLHLLRGLPGSSVQPLEESAAFFAKAALPDERATTQAMSAEALFLLGRTREAWEALASALALTPYVSNPRHSTIVFNAAIDAMSEHELSGARAFFTDRRWEQGEPEDPKVRFLVFVRAAELHMDRGELEQAKGQLQRAELLAERIESEPSRRRAGADLSVIDAQLDREATAAESEQALTLAIDFYRERGLNTSFTNSAFEARAHLRLAGGRIRAGAEDLAEAISIYERRILDAATPGLRPLLAGRAQALYSELILALLQVGETDAAFVWANRRRSFSLHALDFWPRRPLLTMESVLPRPDPGVLLVQLDLLDNTLVRWTLDSATGLNVERVEVEAERLVALVQDLRRDLTSSGAASWKLPRYHALATTLLGDVVTSTPDDSLTVFVLDDRLEGVPLAALPASDGTPLGARRRIARSLSAWRTTPAQARSAPEPGPFERPMIVADPAFDPSRWPLLDRLPHSLAELPSLERLYSNAQVLTADGATSSEFLRQLPEATLVHYAGHAVQHHERPGLNALVLGDAANRSGTVLQSEIYGLSLPRQPIVVLAACSTGTLNVTEVEARSSLSRAFIAAGASSVVATLWPVDDRGSAIFTTSFHRELSRSADPATALWHARVASIDAREPGTSDLSWAAYTLHLDY